jgi:hypothetical protein
MLQVTLGAPTEMTGKRVHIVDSGGSQADYFCALPSGPSNSQPSFLAGVHLIVPLRAFQTDALVRSHTITSSEAIALLNQSWSSVDVRFLGIGTAVLTPRTIDYTVTIPPGALYFLNSPVDVTDGMYNLSLMSSQPIRILEYRASQYIGEPAPKVSLSSPNPPQTRPIFVNSDSVSWGWSPGSPAPSPTIVSVEGAGDFTVSVIDAPWLAFSPAQGTAPATLTLTPNVSGLSQGVYNATVTITPSIPGGSVVPATINVTLTVGPPVATPVGATRAATPPRLSTAADSISVSPASITWSWSPGMPAPVSTVRVDGTATFFPETSAPWLTVTPAHLAILTAPATLTLTANVSALYSGVYRATVSIVPLPNQSLVSLSVPVTLTVTAPAPSGPSTLTVTPSNLSLVSIPGAGQSQLLNVDSRDPYTPFGVSISGAQNLLSFSVLNQALSYPRFYTPATLKVTTSANQPGAYGGTIVLATSDGSVSVPVTLYVTSEPGVQPVMSMIVNAASGLPGALSPGEVIAIYGSGIGSTPIEPTVGRTYGPWRHSGSDRRGRR